LHQVGGIADAAVEGAEVEGQAERVPRAVPIERDALQRDVQVRDAGCAATTLVAADEFLVVAIGKEPECRRIVKHSTVVVVAVEVHGVFAEAVDHVNFARADVEGVGAHNATVVGVAAESGALIIATYNGTGDIVLGEEASVGMAVGDAAAVLTCNAAEQCGVVGIIGGEQGGTGATCHAAAVVAYDTADLGGCAVFITITADGDVAGDCATADGTAVAFVFAVDTHDAADRMITCDAGVGKDDIFQSGVTVKSNWAEEADVLNSWSVDADAADGMAATVESAAEVAVAIYIVADAFEVVLRARVVVPCRLVVERDVVCNLERHPRAVVHRRFRVTTRCVTARTIHIRC